MIHVVPVLIDNPIALQVGNLTITTIGLESTVTDFAMQRARLITWMEQLWGSIDGYSTEANNVVAWPPLALMNANTTYRYPSDVVQYDYLCHWEAPSISNYEVLVSGINWRIIVQGSSLSSYRNTGESFIFCRHLLQLMLSQRSSH